MQPIWPKVIEVLRPVMAFYSAFLWGHICPMTLEGDHRTQGRDKMGCKTFALRPPSNKFRPSYDRAQMPRTNRYIFQIYFIRWGYI